ncbi:MAG: tetratricopeptide repeat protein [Candidatus Eiseniibacteriota bacterium]|nr:MAG: tetratricopeptide repeat protein [Candidatus Eisenbacteria bacterium]
MRQALYRRQVSPRSDEALEGTRVGLGLAILVGLLLAVALGGCAGPARTGPGVGERALAGSRDTSSAPEAPKRERSGAPVKPSPFVQRYEVARRLVLIGELKQAASQLKKLKRSAKSSLEKAMTNELAASLYLARAELRRAEDTATRAIEAERTFSVAHRTRALVRKERGDVEGAIQDFLSALALSPDDLESLRGLAETYLSQGQVEASLSVLGRFLEVDPLDAWAQDTWCESIAALLGYSEFPLEYLRTLEAGAVIRGELAALLVVELELARLQNRYETNDERVVDVLDVPDCHGLWFSPFVRKAIGQKLLRLYPDGTFRPGDVVKRGPLAVELHYFVSRHCPEALDLSSEGESGLSSALQATLSVGVGDVWGYVDVDSSSYLWLPAVSMARLGIVKPDSDILFGAGSSLDGREARDVARSLARTILSSGCDFGH